MNKKLKEEQLKFFVDAFHEVVIPVLEDMEERMATKEDLKSMATKEDLKSMATKEDVEGIDRRLDNVEIKLEKIDDRLDRYG